MSIITINGIKFDSDAIRAAEVTTETSDRSVYITTDDGNLVALPCNQEGVYEFAFAHVRDTDGNVHTLMAEDSDTYGYQEWIEAGETDYPRTSEGNVTENVDGDGNECELREINDVFGVDYENGFCTSAAEYRKAASDYIDGLGTDAKFYLDECRGFANEWKLIIDEEGDAEREEEVRELDREAAKSYLADAVMPGNVYHAEYLSDNCCCSVKIVLRQKGRKNNEDI